MIGDSSTACFSRLPAPICNRTTMAAHAATPGHENERYSDSAGGEVFKGHWWLRPATEPDPAGVQVPPTGATQARGTASCSRRRLLRHGGDAHDPSST